MTTFGDPSRYHPSSLLVNRQESVVFDEDDLQLPPVMVCFGLILSGCSRWQAVPDEARQGVGHVCNLEGIVYALKLLVVMCQLG